MKVALVLTVALTLVACGNKDHDVKESAPKKPDIPNMTLDMLTKLTKNERQELERRCLGVDHPTCTELKGKGLQNHIDVQVYFCKQSASFYELSDKQRAIHEAEKCEDLR